MLEIWRVETMHKSSLWSIFNISSFLGPLQTSISICHILMNLQLRHEYIVLKHIPSFIFNALWNEVKFIDRDPYYHMRRVKEAIHIRLHPNNINKDSGIEIPEAWMPTLKKHNDRRAVRQQTAEGANHWVNSKDWNAPIRAVEKTTNHSRASCFIRSCMTSRPHRLKKTSSMQSKCHNLNHMWLHCETNKKLSFYFYTQYSCK